MSAGSSRGHGQSRNGEFCITLGLVTTSQDYGHVGLLYTRCWLLPVNELANWPMWLVNYLAHHIDVINKMKPAAVSDIIINSYLLRPRDILVMAELLSLGHMKWALWHRSPKTIITSNTFWQRYLMEWLSAITFSWCEIRSSHTFYSVTWLTGHQHACTSTWNDHTCSTAIRSNVNSPTQHSTAIFF